MAPEYSPDLHQELPALRVNSPGDGLCPSHYINQYEKTCKCLCGVRRASDCLQLLLGSIK